MTDKANIKHEINRRNLLLVKSNLLLLLCETPKNKKLLTELGKVVLKIHKLDRKILSKIKNIIES